MAWIANRRFEYEVISFEAAATNLTGSRLDCIKVKVCMASKDIPFMNPGTDEQFGQIAMATREDVLTARAELREMAPVWAAKSTRERARIVKKLQQVLLEHTDHITETITQDTGKSRQDSLIEVFITVEKIHHYCKRASRWLRRRRVSPGLYIFKQYFVEPRPYGTVGVICPWNYPLELTIPPAMTALLAGNCVMIKPSEVTPAVGALVELIFNSVPELTPFVRVLHGDGTVGAAIVESQPDMLFMTGSTATAKKIARAAAENLIPFRHELGGKDPMIILDDADLDAAAKWGSWGACYNAGQTCVSVERVYALESVYDQVVARFEIEMGKLRTDYSADLISEHHYGPITDSRQLATIQEHVQDAVEKGARVLVGGDHEGSFVEPTLLVDVDHQMTLMREETFGPVLPIMKVKSEAEAIRLANDSHFGLSASVWSGDLSRARAVAEQLDVGSVVVNDAIVHYAVAQLPFGGFKQSGDGRSHGAQELLQFTQARSLALGPPPLPFDIATKLRYPGNYGLAKSIMNVVFGTSLEQRIEHIPEVIGALTQKSPLEESKKRTHSARNGRVALGVGGALAASAIVFSLFLKAKRE